MASLRWRSLGLGMSLAILGLGGLCGAAGAQEVLFLKIRPQPETASLGAGGSAAAALAAREAVWARSNARARVILESVCTGCLAPWDPPAPKLVAAAAISELPAPRGVETTPPPGASEPTSDSASRETRP
jgi:hypothetical protein